jgi:hypothetical protein
MFCSDNPQLSAIGEHPECRFDGKILKKGNTT